MESRDFEIERVEVTEDEIKNALGRYARGLNVNGITAAMNQALATTDVDDIEYIHENMITMLDVIKDGDYKYSDYVNAVKYVSYKLMGMPNVEAYKKTFPDRYERLVNKYQNMGLEDDEVNKRISGFVSAYNSNKLVNKLMEQTLIPDYVINAPLRQRAILELANLMTDARSEMVRFNAANSLVTNLKMPETAKIQVDINNKNDAVDALTETIRDLAARQREHIERGMATPREIAEMKIIDVQSK
jgi:hypothetical protein